MRRSILLIIPALLLIANVALAGEPKTPRGVVLANECQQVNNQHLGFTCVFEDGQLMMRLHEPKSKMSQERRKRSDYEFNRLALRYFELGGKGFEVRADTWAPNQRRLCSHVKGRPYYVYSCSDYTVKD